MIRKWLILFLTLLATALLAESTRQASATTPDAPAGPNTPGDPNPLFGGFDHDGKLPVSDFALTDFAFQPDGSVVLAGVDRDNDEGILSRRLPNGSLDSSFGQSGVVRIANVDPFNSPNSFVGIQDDGKIVFVVRTRFNGTQDFLVARFLSNGAPDAGFGANGVVITDFEGGNDSPEAIAFQIDGKIIVAGSAGSDGPTEYALVRYQSNGSLDTSFGSDGKVITDFETGFLAGEGSYIRDIFVQLDGKIVAGGHYEHTYNGGLSTTINFALARYNPDGSLDTSFDGNGKLGTNFSNDTGDRITAIRYLPGGKIVAVGHSFHSDDHTNAIVMARYHSNGELDSSFDGDGKLSFNVGVDDVARDVWVQADGKYVLLVGLGSTGGISLPTLVRLLPDGSLDSNFGLSGIWPIAADGGAGNLVRQPDGKLLVSDAGDHLYRLLPSLDFDIAGQTVTDFAGNDNDVARSILLQPDGKLLVSGSGAAVAGAHDVAVARYLPDGSPDESFGNFGMAHFATNQDEFGHAMALQPDGKIVVAGHMDLADKDFAVYRLTPEGYQDRPPFDTVGFNAVGYRLIDFGIGDDYATAVEVLPDGKILVAGHAWNGTSPGTYNFAMVRLDPDGTTDFSFGTNGKVQTIIGSGSVVVRDMVVMTDGRILLGGGHDTGGAESGQFTLAMYLADGTLDTTFGQANTGIVELGFDLGGNPTYDRVEDLFLLRGGEVLVTGYSSGDWATVVIDGDGDLADYGVQWPIRTEWPLAASPSGVAMQEDGKVVIAGGPVAIIDDSAQFYVARYLMTPGEAGLDTTFGEGGLVMTTVQERGRAYDVAIGGENIYAAGLSYNGRNHDFAVVNYVTDQVPAISGNYRLYLPAIVK